MRSAARFLKSLPVAVLFAGMAAAQATGPDVAKRLDALEKAAKAAQNPATMPG